LPIKQSRKRSFFSRCQALQPLLGSSADSSTYDAMTLAPEELSVKPHISDEETGRMKSTALYFKLRSTTALRDLETPFDLIR
jgi:hypothetical protein